MAVQSSCRAGWLLAVGRVFVKTLVARTPRWVSQAKLHLVARRWPGEGMPTKGRYFAGCTVALVTPFRDGEVDEAGLRRLVEWQIAQGTPVLSPVGTTGESPTLSHQEHERVIAIVVETAAGSSQGGGRNGLELDSRSDSTDSFRCPCRSGRLTCRWRPITIAPIRRACIAILRRSPNAPTYRWCCTTCRLGPVATSSPRRSSGWRQSARLWPSKKPRARSTRPAS